MHGEGPVARAVHDRSRKSLLALVEAASVSPNASQYLPSLAVVYEALAARARVGDKPVDPSILQSLIDAARVERPYVSSLEDFLPHDPRFDVRVEWAGEMFRMVAGTLERPTSDIERLRRLSAIIDPVLHEQNDYGLADVVELVLRRVDAVARTLAPTWPSDSDQESDVPAQLRFEEFTAALNLEPLENQVGQCRNPDRARAALEAHSVPAKTLRCDASSPVATFGSTIAIRHGQNGYTPLPAGLIVEALASLGDDLAHKALQLDSSLQRSWQFAARKFVRDVFVGSGHDVIGPLRDDRFPELHSVIRYSDSQYLALSVVAGLGPVDMGGSIEAATQCLERVLPGSTFRTARGTESIPSSAHLCRLIIISQSQSTMFLGLRDSDCAVVALQDLDWIRRTIGRDQIDLWYFVRDRAEQRRIGRVHSNDGIDLWETWQGQGKSLYSGANQITSMFIAPHHSLTEWQTMAEQRDIELALHALGLGRISAWPFHSFDGTSKLVGNVLSGVLYRLVVCETPVAVALHASSGAEQSPDQARRLGDCFAYKLQCVEGQLVNLMQTNELRSLRIELTFEDAVQELPFRAGSFEDNVLNVVCAVDLRERLIADSRAVESQFGTLLAEVIARGAPADGFVTAWNDAPPGIRLDAISVGPRIDETPRPALPHESHRSEQLAELGARLREEGIQPGSYSGDDAKRIENDIIHPWMITRLHQELAAFDPVAVLSLALTQLEYTNCHRWWRAEKTAYPVGSPREFDEGLPPSGQDLLDQSRSIGLVIEEALARPPSGSRTPTEYEWQELLNLAALAGESSVRSEVLHRGLANPSLVISGLYQVTVDESDINTSIDLESFSRDARSAGLPDPVPVGGTRDVPDPDQEWTPINARLPAYADVEQSLQDSLGFGLDAILCTLHILIRWPVSTPQCTDLVAAQTIAAEVHSANPEIPLADYEAAVEWLSLGADDFASPEAMIKHWEVERRSARVAIRPLVRDGSSVWVLPWTAEIAKRAWVTYLSQYRLPVPDDDLPAPCARALKIARDARNRDFENDCAAQLADLSMLSIPRVKERRARSHGIAHLSGEIDLLCIDSERSLILVIEAKDPFVPLSARSIHTQITQFHEAGGYVDKLDRKVQEIKASAKSLAINKGIAKPDRQWQVIGVMVPRHVTPAAYVRTCQTTFCTINTLRETIIGGGIRSPINSAV